MAVGVKASASLSTLEMVMSSIFDGTCTADYILELVALETSGKSRSEKVNRTIRRMTVNNKLLPFIKEHSSEFMADIRSSNSRSAVFTALMCAAYPLFYDTVSLLGKYFHAQDTVTTAFLFGKLKEQYGSSTDADIAFNSTVKMLVDAGLIMRPHPGVYAPCFIDKASDFARDFYHRAFLINNPNLSQADEVSSYPFFEFFK